MMSVEMEKPNFSCYVFGEESLVIHCIEVLIKQDFTIKALITAHPQLQDWAAEQKIKVIPPNANLDKLLIKKVDYIFSIVNPRILSAALLNKAKKLAINYHDALLPAYAGVHATAWALLNEEKNHGISWHVMTATTDGGAILKQVSVPIESGETALSLNLKCYEAALAAFKELVQELVKATYQARPQDLSQRTYYGLTQKPPGNAWVDWNDSAENIEKMFRVVKWGDCANRFAALKFIIKNQLYIVDDLAISEKKTNKAPGTVIHIKHDAIHVATNSKNIIIKQLKSAAGKICEIKELNKILVKATVLFSPSPKLQNDYYQRSIELARYEPYWLGQLQNFKSITLPFLEMNAVTSNTNKKQVFVTQFTLPVAVRKKLKEKFAKDKDQKTILLTILLVYLYRITSQEQLSVDISYTGLKLNNKISPLIAHYIPFNLQLKDNFSFKKCLALVNKHLQNVQNKKSFLADIYARFPELSKLNDKHTIGLILANSIDAKLNFSHLVNFVITKYAIDIYVNKACLNKNLTLFLENIPGNLGVIVKNFVLAAKAISEFSLLTEKERKKILVEWNDTKAEYPKNKNLYQLFHEQVDSAPNKIAIDYLDKKITYIELNDKANNLAVSLSEKIEYCNSVIAICMEDKLNTIISIIALLKLNITYSPIDPNLPFLRIRHILKDLKAKYVITEAKFYEYFSKKDLVVFDFKKILKVDKDITIKILPEFDKVKKLAYIIYTSGTTGNPKGVAIEEEAVLNLVFAKKKFLKVSEEDRLLNFSNFGFDASVWELFPCLLSGATLCIGRKIDILPGITLTKFLKRKKITIATLPPSILHITPAKNLNDLRIVISAGERCIKAVVDKWSKGRIFLNAYGITEATVCSTLATCPPSPFFSIGKPISNVKAYVVDNKKQLLPIGVQGELLIGGVSLATGYFNNAKLTKEKFVVIPSLTPREKFYKTGDLVRWLPNGNLEYIGRLDEQVKIYGNRIELREIESALLKHPGISQAVACVREVESRKQIEVYYIPKKNRHNNLNIDPIFLQKYLKKLLPSYMLPAKFVLVKNFPLTFNNKVDKKWLLDKYRDDSDLKSVPGDVPLTVEEKLLAIWRDLLQINNISIEHNFFNVGGDSITAMQVVAKANNCGIVIHVKDIFQFPTISLLANYIHQQKASINNKTRVKVNLEFDLSPIQSWFFEQKFKYKEQFSQVCYLTLKRKINVAILERALQAWVEKFYALNLRFKYVNGNWSQYYVAYKKHKILEVIECRNNENREGLLEQWPYKLQQSFNLENGPLLKAVLLMEPGSTTAKLVIVIHHLVVDGVSWRVLIRDLMENYQSVRDPDFKLESKFIGSSYQDWVQSLHNYAFSSAILLEKEFWKKMCVVNSLRIDYKHGPNLEKYSDSVTVELNEEETTHFLHIIPGLYASPVHTILLSVAIKTLLAWQGIHEIVIDMESHGREEISEKLNLSQTVGWFTSLYPMYFSNMPKTLADIIVAVKAQLQRVPFNGIGYGLLSYIKKEPLTYKSDILFNYWGQFQSSSVQDICKLEEISLVSHPDNKRTHLLNIDILVKHGKLIIKWTYSSNHHKLSTIENLAQIYVSCLKNILAESQKKLIKSCFPGNANLGSPKAENINAYHNYNEITVYPLSPLQKGLLFHAVSAPTAGSYVVQLTWKSPKNSFYNLEYLRQAWQLLMQRHAVLRTSFLWEEAIEPAQVIQPYVELPWKEYDWTHEVGTFVESERLTIFLQADRQAGFQLSQAPLLRITIIKASHEQFYLIVTFHHILLDGWSLPILIKELGDFYQAVETNKQTILQPPVSYNSYLDWQRKQNLDQAEQFWKDYLKGFLAPNDIAIINKHEKKNDSVINVSSNEFILSASFSSRIRSFCQQYGLTLNTFFQAAWTLVLSRYSQDEDIIFGITLTGRSPSIPKSDQIVGLLVNTIPLRIKLKAKEKIIDFLVQVQEAFAQAAHFHYTPLYEIQKWSEVPNSTPLFNSILVFENYPKASLNQKFIKFEDIKIIDPTHYPLSYIVFPERNIRIKLAYDENRVDSDAIIYLKGHLETIFRSFINYPNQFIKNVSILTKKEYKKILIDWNKTEFNYHINKTLDELFEDQVKTSPERIAVIFEGLELTYQELNCRVNQLAYILHSRYSCINKIVAICLDRSIEMVVSILGVLKSGNAYVPIDPSYPKNRIEYILSDSNPEVILTSSLINLNLLERESYRKLVFVDKLSINAERVYSNLIVTKNLNAAIYVIYTSGSTGQPKGVINTHRGLLNRLLWMCSNYPLSESDVVLQKTPFVFDVSFWEILWPLISGARLAIAKPEGHKDPLYLKKVIVEQRITTIHFVPCMLLELLKLNDVAECSYLKRVICSGEILNFSLKEEFYKKLYWVKLYNLYGPTEASIEVTAWDCSEDLEKNITSIGKPISNTKIYILDNYLNPVPIGVKGELYIGGFGIAKGYLNKPELTNKNFIYNPFFKERGKKIYKSGDFAKWLPNGNIEYIGRRDNQLKIRGLRIELSEIELCLEKYTNINQAVVIVKGQESGKKLIAFLLLNNKKNIILEELRKFLKQYLPTYMIPADFIILDKFPLTNNGKVDKNKLLKMDFISYRKITNLRFSPPKNDIEKSLSLLWSEVLGMEKLGVDDNFFYLGGDSLLALHLLARIYSQYHVHMSIRSLFDAPTIKEFSQLLEEEKLVRNMLSLRTITREKEDKFNCLIPLRENGNKFPLFLVHPIGGTIFWYTRLLNYLNSSRPCYGIQDPGIEASGTTFKTVEEMAAYYIKAIKTIQSKGPYFLAGASAGGNINVEIAYQLRKSGSEIGFVGLFDTWVPYPDLLLNKEFFEANMRRQYNAMYSKIFSNSDYNLERLLKLQWERLQMYAKYKTPIIDFKLTLFKASNTIPVYQTVADPFNHWSIYSLLPIQLYTIPGDHETMFQEPNVSVLGKRLDGCLNNAEITSQADCRELAI